MLALTHPSSRYGGGELRREAREVFAATESPRDFDTIDIPFPDRGGARLVPWSERQAAHAAEQAGNAAAEGAHAVASP
jgi:ribonuclease Z